MPKVHLQLALSSNKYAVLSLPSNMVKRTTRLGNKKKSKGKLTPDVTPQSSTDSSPRQREGLRPNRFIDPSDQQPPTDSTLHFSDDDITDATDEAPPKENESSHSTIEQDTDSIQSSTGNIGGNHPNNSPSSMPAPPISKRANTTFNLEDLDDVDKDYEESLRKIAEAKQKKK
eukprot:15326912-Ditylum_brightwellii.AAC.1